MLMEDFLDAQMHMLQKQFLWGSDIYKVVWNFSSEPLDMINSKSNRK